MGSIVAIGGGSLSGPSSIRPIHQEIVHLTGKNNPHVLFIPTASADSADYISRMHKEFIELNCTIDVLYLTGQTPPHAAIAHAIKSADIIYVGGGNTLKMMNRWRKLGVDKLLHQAYKDNKVLCGPSAGSICWFAYGNSDSRKDKNPQAPLIKVTGLGMINALHCPHYDSEKDRKASLKAMMQKLPRLVAIAIDDCCALQIINNEYRILATKNTANAYKVYWHDGIFYEQIIEKTPTLRTLTELLVK
jgi:dipeptidase E